jgi:hypothetical protein
VRSAQKRLIAVPFIMLVLTVTACGGATVAYEPAPGEPVDLSVPGNGDALAPAATPTPTPTSTETPDSDDATAESAATPDPNAGAGAGAAQSTPQDNGQGAAEAPAEPDSATNDQPPPAGSDAQEFENFCAENPGAC